MKSFFLSVLLLVVMNSCSSLIYSIRGPKYEMKYSRDMYPELLDSTRYYYSERQYSQRYFEYIKFDCSGFIKGGSIAGEMLSANQVDSMFDGEPVKKGLEFIFKRGYLRWEVYSDSYNGYNLYKAKVYKDSIIAWQIGNKRASTITYYKLVE